MVVVCIVIIAVCVVVVCLVIVVVADWLELDAHWLSFTTSLRLDADRLAWVAQRLEEGGQFCLNCSCHRTGEDVRISKCC